MKIEIPKNCPCCDSLLELVKDQLFCRNNSCSAKVNKQIEHFCKTLGIKGMGEKTIQKLELADISEIYYLDKDTVIKQLGSEKLACKLLQEIDSSRSAELNKVLVSFSIPLLGNTASEKICSQVNHISEINYETCKNAGLGDKVTYNLLTWLEVEFVQLKEFLPFSFYSNNSTVNSTNKTICITGKLSSYATKAEAYKHLRQHNFTVSESVTKTLAYLVDEENKGSIKRKKAEQFGITIISNLNNFLREIKQ